MNLLAGSVSAGLILDIVFLALIVVGMVIGCIRGFVRTICKFGGTILAAVLAFSFCTPLQTSLENAFGFTTLIVEGVKVQWLGAFLSIAVCFVGLFIVTKLAAWLFGKIAKALIDKSKVVGFIDRILGAIVGAAEALLLCFIILTVFHWLDIAAINTFIESSVIVKAVYTSPWFLEATLLPGRILK